MKAKRFADVSEVKMKTSTSALKSPRKSFQQWEQRCYKCIDSKREYFEVY
jgi:hypothetical protein